MTEGDRKKIVPNVEQAGIPGGGCSQEPEERWGARALSVLWVVPSCLPLCCVVCEPGIC